MRSRRRRPVRRRVLVSILLFFLLLIGVGLMIGGKYLPIVWDLITRKPIQLKTASSQVQTVNVLLLGVGGGSHDGPDLTDTIIFASIDPVSKSVTLVSLPRDLWSPDINAKVNAGYTFAEEKNPGSGLTYTKSEVSTILGQPIDYAIKLDFSGFEKMVDKVGGLDINVDNSFDDYQYPVSGKEDDSCGLSQSTIANLSAEVASGSASETEAFPCRYEHLHIIKGEQHMDGTTALKYVRSRHATGVEGSDFARSKRQEKVITAFKAKIFSVDTFLNPGKLVDLVNVLNDSIKTDIKQSEYADFIRLGQEMKGAKIRSAILDTGSTADNRLGLLINPPISAEYGNQWVLSPRIGNGHYAEIHEYVACELKGLDCTVGQSGILTPTPVPTKAPK